MMCITMYNFILIILNKRDPGCFLSIKFEFSISLGELRQIDFFFLSIIAHDFFSYYLFELVYKVL